MRLNFLNTPGRMFTCTRIRGFQYTEDPKVNPEIVVIPCKTNELERILLTIPYVVVKLQSNRSCHVITKSLVKNFGPDCSLFQSPENSYISRTPRFSTMVKSLITAAHWNTANANLYQQPWTTDTQNRFFSLQAWGPISGQTFLYRQIFGEAGKRCL